MRTRYAAPLLVAVVGAVVGCRNGEIDLFGYRSDSLFDPNIRTVYIPVFKNIAFVTDPHRGVEVDVTQEIVKELGRRKGAPKVLSNPATADSELIGTVIAVNKTVLNRTPQNLTREADLAVQVQVLWRDLRTGAVLTNRPKQAAAPPPATFDPTVPAPGPPAPDDTPNVVTVTGVGKEFPELGSQGLTAQQQACHNLARQIVNMMESPWALPAK